MTRWYPCECCDGGGCQYCERGFNPINNWRVVIPTIANGTHPTIKCTVCGNYAGTYILPLSAGGGCVWVDEIAPSPCGAYPSSPNTVSVHITRHAATVQLFFFSTIVVSHYITWSAAYAEPVTCRSGPLLTLSTVNHFPNNGVCDATGTSATAEPI